MLSVKYFRSEWPLLAAIAAGALGFAFEHAAVHAGGAALWGLFALVLAAVIGVAFRIAHHAEVLAVRLGEPYGTLILTVSAVSSSSDPGLRLLAAYSAGLGVPFLLTGAFLHEISGRLRGLRRAGPPLQAAAGVVMIAVGIAIMSGELSAFSYWLLEKFPVLGRIG